MSPFTTYRSSCDGLITITPNNQTEQSGLVVICHGLGDTAEGFVDVAERLAAQMPHIKFVLPTATSQPVTMNMGMAMPSWYDIVGLDERSNESCNGIEQSRSTITRILENENRTTGLKYNRMALVGFSQGGALSLYTGMQLPNSLAGIVVLSGYLPNTEDFFITSGLETTPVLHCHGTADPMVQYTMAVKTQKVMHQKGATNYQLKKYPGVQHTVSMDEIRDVESFLVNILPDDANSRIRLKDPRDMTVKELHNLILNLGLQKKAIGLREKCELVRLVKDHQNGRVLQ